MEIQSSFKYNREEVVMEELIQVQRYSENECYISGFYEGNTKATYLVIMVHDGGNNKDENGAFPIVEDSNFKKIQGKIEFQEKEYGNYEILSNTLTLKDEFGVFRYDLRNYGDSKLDNTVDKRDMLYERYAKDLRDIIKYLRNKYPFKKVSFVGTGVGGLIIEYYLTKYLELPKEMMGKAVFICPNSPKIIYNLDSKYSFSYQKYDYILKTNKQFTKIKGIYEGLKTIYEAENNYNLDIEYASKMIPSLFILSLQDKMYPWEVLTSEIENIKRINKDVELEVINTLEGAFHGIYDYQSSNYMLMKVYEYLKEE